VYDGCTSDNKLVLDSKAVDKIKFARRAEFFCPIVVSRSGKTNFLCALCASVVNLSLKIRTVFSGAECFGSRQGEAKYDIDTTGVIG